MKFYISKFVIIILQTQIKATLLLQYKTQYRHKRQVNLLITYKLNALIYIYIIINTIITKALLSPC